MDSSRDAVFHPSLSLSRAGAPGLSTSKHVSEFPPHRTNALKSLQSEKATSRSDMEKKKDVKVETVAKICVEGYALPVFGIYTI